MTKIKQGSANAKSSGENTSGNSDGPVLVVRSSIKEAQRFYESKSKRNQRRYNLCSRVAWVSFGFGAAMLSLHAYGFLVPVFDFLNISETSNLGFLAAKPTVLPTVLLALGGFGFSWTSGRGYLNAWLRSSLTLSNIKMLELRMEVEVAAKDQGNRDVAREFAGSLIEVIKAERQEWAVQTRQDLESLNNPDRSKVGASE